MCASISRAFAGMFFTALCFVLVAGLSNLRAQEPPSNQFGDNRTTDIFPLRDVDMFTFDASAGDLVTVRVLDVSCFGNNNNIK